MVCMGRLYPLVKDIFWTLLKTENLTRDFEGIELFFETCNRQGTDIFQGFKQKWRLRVGNQYQKLMGRNMSLLAILIFNSYMQKSISWDGRAEACLFHSAGEKKNKSKEQRRRKMQTDGFSFRLPAHAAIMVSADKRSSYIKDGDDRTIKRFS